jgi:formylglycine-generating enzyme required for sulfatase activity
MARRLALAWALLGSAFTAGCGLLLDYSGLSGGGGAGGTTTSTSQTTSTSATTSQTGSTSSSTGTGGGAGGADAGIADAGEDGGPIAPLFPPVTVQGSGGVDFRIDATEVTVAQYRAFVKDYPQHPPELPNDRCVWNTVVAPNAVAPGNDAGATANPGCAAFNLDATAAADPHAPVRCVDWCDAFMYCLWAGGRLCQSDEGGNAREWRTACQGGNTQAYPYGSTYLSGRCVEAPASKPSDVHSKPACEGGVTGLFDMSGNVAEWVDCGCENDDPDPLKTSPYVAGGSYLDMGATLSCTDSRREQIHSFHPDVGFRCCYGP